MARIRQHSIYASFGLLLTTAVALSIIYAVSLTEAVDLTPYFGGLPPILAALIVCAAGLAAFYVLYMRLDFSICQLRSFWRGLSFATVLVAPFMIVVTISDLVSPFPADINVALPTALAFYPAMGFIAQIALHIVPFALLIVIGDIFLSALNLNLRL